jgi:putative ABC transport system permease protein
VKLVTRFFGSQWSLPIVLITIILVFDIASAALAVYAPAKRIRNMPITATINEL